MDGTRGTLRLQLNNGSRLSGLEVESTMRVLLILRYHSECFPCLLIARLHAMVSLSRWIREAV